MSIRLAATAIALAAAWAALPPVSARDAAAQATPPRIERSDGAAAPARPEVGLLSGVPLAPHYPDRASPPYGIIDSGILLDHPQIGDIVVEARDFTGEGVEDHSGHGTQVALIFLNEHYQISDPLKASETAPSSDRPPGLAIAKIVGRRPAPPQEVATRMIEAIAWLGSLGVDVLGISIAWPAGSADFEPLCDAIARSGMIVAAAAGNFGPRTHAFPASCPAGVIAVGAVGVDGRPSEYNSMPDIVAAPPPPFLSPAAYHLVMGQQMMRDKHIDAAETAFRTALAAEPSNEERTHIEYMLGLVAAERGLAEEAVAHFRVAAERAPETPWFHDALAFALARLGHLDEALVWAERGLAASPDYPPLLDRKARALLDLARPTEALEAIEALERLAPDTQGLDQIRFAARNLISIENAVESGTPPGYLLLLFSREGDAHLVRFMLRRYGLDPNVAPAGANILALTAAAFGGHVQAMHELLSGGARADVQDMELRISPLMAAAMGGHLRAVRILVEHGAPLDSTDSIGFTALMFAAEVGHIPIVQLLLEAGAATSPRSVDGLDALALAVGNGQAEIAELLRETQTTRNR